MSVTIDQAFIKKFEAEVHEAYQQRGAKLRNTVRLKTNVEGKSDTFQKVGKGTAGQKTRHGLVPVMNVDHTPIECTLQDWYGGDWVDKLDELKTNIDERKVTVNAGAYALGRKLDNLIITAMDATTTFVGDYSAGMTKPNILAAFEKLNDKEVPDDLQRFAVVGAHQWSELKNLPEFSDSDFAGNYYAWLKGTESRVWMNCVWVFHSGLPLSGTNRTCFLYHRTAVGAAEGAGISTDITWHGDRAAHFVDNMMSFGAILIDAEGVCEIRCKDDSSIS